MMQLNDVRIKFRPTTAFLFLVVMYNNNANNHIVFNRHDGEAPSLGESWVTGSRFYLITKQDGIDVIVPLLTTFI